MKIKICSIFIGALCTCIHPVFSQKEKEFKFKINKVTVSDLQKKVYDIDSNAQAVVLFDIGETEFTNNNKGSFSIRFKRHKRMHILHKNAFDEATVGVVLYHNENYDEEVLEEVNAVTYNLEDGIVVPSKLERKKAVFKDKLDKNRDEEKFTLPNVKEGCIIDFEYTLKSDFIFNLQPWTFQDEYPTLWSEYKTTIPDLFQYVTLTQGFLPYFRKNEKPTTVSYNLVDSRSAEASQRDVIVGSAVNFNWAMKDVPALKTEPFISTLNNYVSRLTFQYKGYKRNDGFVEIELGDYKKLAKEYFEKEHYGECLNFNNNWLDETMVPLLSGKNSEVEKAHTIFNYVRDNYTCTDHSALYMDNPIKTVAKTKKGSVVEINNILIAMLRHAKLDAVPVIISTRNHGLTNEFYPLIEKFNYAVTALNIDSTEYFLDATDPLIGFNHLPLKCYNFHGRKMNENATPVYFIPDKITEAKVTSIFLSVENGLWNGYFQQKNGYYNSYAIRDQVKEKGKDAFFNTIKKAYNLEGIVFKNTSIDSLTKLDENIEMSYEFEFKPESDDVIYLNPMFDEGERDNPFKSAKRFFPVEMPYSFDDTYILNFDIPEGYVVDEAPKSVKAMFNEDEGFFEYIIAVSAEKVQMRSRIKLLKATYSPEDYETLRDFYAMIVKKHAEQIVLKKKK